MSQIHEVRQLKSKQYAHLERVKNGLKNQVLRFGEQGFPEIFYPWVDQTVTELTGFQAPLLKEIVALWQGDPVATLVEETAGLGPALYFVLGLLPPLDVFPNPAKLWRYCGLHPEGARRAQRGQFDGFSRRLKAYTIQRLAVPCEKHRASPYRALYDHRKEATLATHPTGPVSACSFCERAKEKTTRHVADHSYTRERTGQSFDCAASGGPHWSAGHRRADALRVTAKAIMLDAWRVTHGFAPKLGAIVVLSSVPPLLPAEAVLAVSPECVLPQPEVNTQRGHRRAATQSGNASPERLGRRPSTATQDRHAAGLSGDPR